MDKVESCASLSEQISGILQNLSDAVISMDVTTGEVLFLNPAAEKLFGRTFDEFKKDKNIFINSIHPLDRADIEKAITHLLEEKSCSREYRIVRPDGNIRWVFARSRLGINKPNNKTKMDCVISDITDSKMMQEKMDEDRKKIHSYFDLADIIFLILDPNGKILNINIKGCKILEYEKEEILGKNWFEHFITDKEEKEIMTFFDDILTLKYKDNNKLVKIKHENAVLTKSKKERQISWNNTVLFNPNGNADIVIAVGEDITELRNSEHEKETLQRQLFQSAKLASLGTLGAGIAHELNNPLAIISGYSEQIIDMSKDDNLEKSFLEESLGKILAQVSKMAFIINHIKEFSRSTDPKSRTLVDIKKLIEDSILLFRKQLTVKGINIYIEIQEYVKTLWGNNFALESVLHNLIANARDAFDDFTPEGTEEKKITIRAYIISESNNVVIELIDNGKGIQEQNINKVFDPFFTTKDVGKGTGLGLSLCYGIISDHKGTIEFTSKEKEGTTFKITLPVDMRDGN